MSSETLLFDLQDTVAIIICGTQYFGVGAVVIVSSSPGVTRRPS
jgi:hypothetical protein